jgi:hypothetical protein
VSRRAARHLALALIGLGGLVVVVIATIAWDARSPLAALAAVWLFNLWVWALIRFDKDTERWGPW